MKKLLFVLMMALVTVLACVGCSAMSGYETSTLEFKAGNIKMSDDGITLDGTPDEEIWNSVAHHTHTESEVKIDTATVFGRDGLYIGVSVDVKGVYFVEPFNFNLNSCIAVFIAPSDLPYDKYGTGYFVITNDPFYSNSTSPVLYLSKTVAKGEMNSKDATGMCTEIYLPYSSLGYEQQPESIDLYVNYNRTRGDSSAKANGTWIKAARNDSVAFYYTFDEGGFVNADKEGDALGDCVDGTTKTGGWDLSKRSEGIYHSVRRDNQFIFVRDELATDYSIEATVRAVGGIHDGGPHWGIMTAAQGDKKYAMLIEGSTALKTKRLKLRTLDYTSDWVLSAPGVERDSVDIFGEGVRLKAIKDGDTLYYIVNGELVYSEKTSLSGAAACGLYTVGGEAYFSGVRFVNYDGNKSGLYAALAECSGNAIILPNTVVGGRITSEKSVVADGEDAKIYFAAQSGYKLKTVIKNGRNVTAEVAAGIVNGVWTTDADTDLRISAIFEKLSDGEKAVVSGTLKSDTDDKIGEVKLTLSGDGLAQYEIDTAGNAFSVEVARGDYEMAVKAWVHYGVTTTVNADSAAVTLPELQLTCSRGLPVNAVIKTDGGDTLMGDCEYIYGDGCVYGKEVGLLYTLLDGSLGKVGMVTATINLKRVTGDSDSSAGFVFLPAADRDFNGITDTAKEAGYTILWWQGGIRSYNFSDADAAGWKAGSGYYENQPSLGLKDFRNSSESDTERLTVVRKGTTYFVFRHYNNEVRLITTREYKAFSGEAAIGFMTSGCVANYADYDFSVDEDEVDAFLTENLPDPKFNASIKKADGSVITGNTAYKKLGESSARGTDNGRGLKWSYIEGSYGAVNMVSARITLVNNDYDASPSAGFTFSTASNANESGFHILWFKTGIRSFNNTLAANGGWVAGQGTFVTDTALGLTSFESKTALTMTVIRKNAKYFVLINGTLVTVREYDGVSGDAAVGFVTSGCTAKYEDITVTTDAAAINGALEGVGITE